MREATKKGYIKRRLKHQREGLRHDVEKYLDINVTYTTEDLLRAVQELDILEKMVKDLENE